jgi:hypothetical protein
MITIQKNASIGKAVDVVGWVLFVIWVVVAIVIRPFGPGVDSLGVGIIVLAVATGRFLSGGTITFNWMAIGLIFAVAGIGRMIGIDLPLFSFALILCGLVMLLHSRARKN